MTRPQKLLPYLAILVPGVAWMIPMFTQLYKAYPTFGSTLPHGLALGAVLGGICAAVFYFTGGHEKTRTRTVVGNYVLIAIASVISGTMWAPIVNASISLGDERVVEGEVHVIENPGRGNPTRRVTAVLDGAEVSGTFYGQKFWEYPVVRAGGRTKLTVRAGLLGLPWIARFDDPAP